MAPQSSAHPQSESLPVVAVDPIVEALWPLRQPEFTVPSLRSWTAKTLRSHLTGDQLRDNLILNKWEFAQGKAVLESYPWRLSVPFILCNAKCDFCAAWLMKGHSDLDELIASLSPVIRRCYQLDLVGWGEPLVHPQFGKILDTLKREADARARLALTTNGVLLAEWIDRLLEANVMEYAISIHATKEETHRDLMGFGPGKFDLAKRAVQKLADQKARHPELSIELVLVVTRQNITEIPAFIEMSERLGADKVHLRTLMPVVGAPREGLDYHRLPPYLHPEFDRLREAAVLAIDRASLPVKASPETWSRPVFDPEWESRLDGMPLTPRGGRRTYGLSEIQWDALGAGEENCECEPWDVVDLYGRSAPLYCPSPYTAFYVNGTDRRVIPCVYMHKVPNHEFIHFKPNMSFEQVWNSPAMVAVRRHLHQGPLMPACLKCPFHC